MNGNAIIKLVIHKRNFETILEVPLTMSANDLVMALNDTYELGIDVADMKSWYLKTENPIALLKGNKTLGDYGVRNGTVINITE